MEKEMNKKKSIRD